MPLEPAVERPSPSEFDVLISDIKDADFQSVAQELQCPARLTPVQLDATFPVQGLLYGPSHRIIVPIVVQKRLDRVLVLFVLDTGSPNTYLRADTLSALGHQESIPESTQVSIHGMAMTVFPSHAHFSNVDLLGADFLRAIYADLRVNYLQLTASISSLVMGMA
jgi:hypothetical protein